MIELVGSRKEQLELIGGSNNLALDKKYNQIELTDNDIKLNIEQLPQTNIELKTQEPVDTEAYYKQGRLDEYNTFWDNFQQYGARDNYNQAFYRAYWNDENFNPKYDMQPINAGTMFRECGMTHYVDKVKVDFSKNTNFSSTFNASKLVEIGVVDMRNATTSTSYTIYNMPNLIKVEKVILAPTTICNAYTFSNNQKLESITFEGELVGAINVRYSKKLNKDSIISIINVLSATTGGNATLSKQAVNNAFETSEGAADGSTSEEWLALAATKSNWDIVLSN